MKIKKAICLILAVGVLGQTSLTLALEEIPVLSEEGKLVEEDLIVEEEPVVAPVSNQLISLDGFSSADSEGNVSIPESGIFDFLFPEELKGEAIFRIGPEAFKGCSYFRTVAIPATVTEIGEGAFSDCETLERIILLGRSDDSDMILGDNWSGDAEVIFEFSEEEQEEPEAVVEEEETNENTTTEETISDETSSEETSTETAPATEVVEEIVPEDPPKEITTTESEEVEILVPSTEEQPSETESILPEEETIPEEDPSNSEAPPEADPIVSAEDSRPL